MPPVAAATTLRGALLVLGTNDKDDPQWLDAVNRRLGAVLTGMNISTSMHGIFGWIMPGSPVGGRVLGARQRAVEPLPSLSTGRVRLEVVTSVHTVTVALAFFDVLRSAVADPLSLQAPAEWHQEDHSLVVHLYSDSLPPPSASRDFQAHLADVRRWAADRFERISRVLHGALRTPASEFASTVVEKYAASFLALTTAVPEFVVWVSPSDPNATSGLTHWLSSWHVRREGPLGVLGDVNRAALRQDTPDLPSIDRLYVSPAFRVTAAGPSARLVDDGWWTTEVPLRNDFELMLAGHLSSPLGISAPLLVIGDTGSGKSTVAKVLAAAPPIGDAAVVRVPLRDVAPDRAVADEVDRVLRGLTGGALTWADLADRVPVVVLDGLDELEADRDYLEAVFDFQRIEAARGRPTAVVVTSQTSFVDRSFLPDGTRVVRLEPFDEARVRAWVDRWNEATADTPRRRLPMQAMLARMPLASRPQLLFLAACHLTDPTVPEQKPGFSTTALLEQLAELHARRTGSDSKSLALAEVETFFRHREWRDLVGLLSVRRTRSGPLADYQIASFLLEELSAQPDGDDLARLLPLRSLASRPAILEMLVVLADEMHAGKRFQLARGLSAKIQQVTRPAMYRQNLQLLLSAVGPGSVKQESGRSGVEFVHRSLEVGTTAIGQLTWSADGGLVSAISGDRLTFLDVAGEIAEVVENRPKARDVAWHPTRPVAAIVEANHVVVAGFDGRFARELCRVRSGTRVSWSPDGSTLALLDRRSLRLVDAATGVSLGEHIFAEAGQEGRAYLPAPRWTKNGQHIVVVRRTFLLRTVVHLVRAEDLVRVWSSRPNGEMLDFAPSDDNLRGAFVSRSESAVRVLDIRKRLTVAVLNEHTAPILSAKFSPDGSLLATLSQDNTARLWRTRDWQCVATIERTNVERRGGLAFHPTEPLLAIKDGATFDVVRLHRDVLDSAVLAKTARRYTNAKVVLVGDTGVGKSGLGLVLSGKPFEPTESTHGRNVWTFEKAHATLSSGDVHTRETLLWDLAGQPGYRMVHQLHLNEVAVALVVFDARSETDPFAGVQYWSRALAQAQRLDGAEGVRMRTFLVAARADRGTVAVSRERIQETMKTLGFDRYVETSAKEGWGVEDLVREVREGIDWDELPVVSSTELFEAIKDFVVEEKQYGRVLTTVDDLAHSFRRTQLDTTSVEELVDRFSACVGRLESVGVVRRLSFGDHVLLRPELLDSYASSLVQAAKDEPDGLGFVREDDALEGRFRLPADERLTNQEQERILLNAVVQELLRREIALREVTDREVDLIFPSQFTRERPDAPRLPGQDVVFTFDGPLYSIYSTLAVRLSHSRFFERHEMWHNSATYLADAGGTCGIAIREVEEGRGELALFYDEAASPIVRRQFEAYVVEHLEQRAGDVEQRRVRRCGSCDYAVTDEVVQLRLDRGMTTVTCQLCDGVVQLVDEEQADVRPVVEEMNSHADAQRDQDVTAVTLKGKRDDGAYDVFLCHNEQDKPLVLELATRLEARGLLPWLDVHDIKPGSHWQVAMAEGIAASRAAAVIIGPGGRGRWREAEMELIQDLALGTDKPVIPVILDGTDGEPDFPGFLRIRSAVDMRKPYPDPFEQLVWGITGEQQRWS
ncbi:WD40 repeat [Lentzea fradiae]|uniref:WD40 repeat n=1 Tax=Lentzea fradiae TaxID=200378 RepID=A0A1G7T914_9PSEU|nr:TIR domain-containing protein [Lentzea fradiae]SDG31572.1 WD40 repeat [Lentzea fradiae]